MNVFKGTRALFKSFITDFAQINSRGPVVRFKSKGKMVIWRVCQVGKVLDVIMVQVCLKVVFKGQVDGSPKRDVA